MISTRTIQKRFWCIGLILAGLLLTGTPAINAQTSIADEPPQFVPLGVYLSWEIPFRLSKFADIPRWEYIGKILDLCVAQHVNTLWVTNLHEPDLPQLISECEKRNLKLVVSLGSIEAKIKGRWSNDAAYYKSAVPRVIKLAGDSTALVGWVLSDEPRAEDMDTSSNCG
ncbi:MAG: hypothetical protein JKX85_05165 [Phycisphaeraceae bacterium]|nr:hypothetical protein [Phycisphaeraceae bacterium]